MVTEPALAHAAAIPGAIRPLPMTTTCFQAAGIAYGEKVRLRTVVTGSQRTGLLFVGAPSVPEMVRLAQRAEERGFDSIWVAETRMTRDGFVPLAAIAAATKRARASGPAS